MSIFASPVHVPAKKGFCLIIVHPENSSMITPRFLMTGLNKQDLRDWLTISDLDPTCGLWSLEKFSDYVLGLSTIFLAHQHPFSILKCVTDFIP